MVTVRNAQASIKRFHDNEDGLEALQVVMIIAVAAVALIFVKKNWNDSIKPWFDELLKQIYDFKQ